MSLVGTYFNQSTGETLDIKEANADTGLMSGTLTILSDGGKLSASVLGHYHFINSLGPQTSIAFIAVADNSPSTPSIYEGWAGTTSSNNYAQLDMLGSRSILESSGKSSMIPIGGPFVRQ